MENTHERQLDSVFTAKEAGEYKFCFNNEMSTFAEKLVDFEIAVRSALFLGPKQRLSVTANDAAILRPICSIGSIENYPLTSTFSPLRSKTNHPPPSSPLNKAPPPNRPPPSKNPS